MESNFLKECEDELQNMRRLLFRVLAVTACLSNTLGFVANIISHGWSRVSVFIGACMLLMYLLFFLGETKNLRERASFWMIVLSTLIEFPLM